MKRLLRMLVGAAIACTATATAVGGAAAQRPSADPLARALDLERRGSFAEAVEAYKAVLAARPADPSALLGLERALQPLNRSVEILPIARAALATGPGSAVYGILVRAFMASRQNDSARTVVERWAASAPRDEAPYREWVIAALANRDRSTAKAALGLGRQRLRRGDAFASDMAQILAAEGNWEGAALEWVAATRQLPGYLMSGTAALAAAPERTHEGILKSLARIETQAARQLQAGVMARWGDPIGGVTQLIAALPAERSKAAESLAQFVDAARQLSNPPASQARAMALEELARRSVGLAASRARVEAARAYSDAGDREGARRMLSGIAEDTVAGPASASARATLIGVLVDDGKMDEAERRLSGARGALTTDEFQALTRRVALGWARAGDLDRAERAIRADSTVEGIALAGRIAIFRGDIVGGVSRLRLAGPYAGTREEATERTALLALLQPLERDTLRELGAALLLLERGDSAGAATALERLSAGFPPAGGSAELRLLAGRVLRGIGRNKDAERLLRAAATEEAPTAAPAAELELARLLIGVQRAAEAIPLLEHLILTYPSSALVPQARRALDEARGAIPRT